MYTWRRQFYAQDIKYIYVMYALCCPLLNTEVCACNYGFISTLENFRFVLDHRLQQLSSERGPITSHIEGKQALSVALTYILLIHFYYYFYYYFLPPPLLLLLILLLVVAKFKYLGVVIVKSGASGSISGCGSSSSSSSGGGGYSNSSGSGSIITTALSRLLFIVV